MEDDAPGVPEWVVTYGDMMSLLLTFFIMLVSMSELKSDEGTVRAMMDSLEERFGPDDGSAGSPGKSLQNTSTLKEINSSGSRREGGMKKFSRDSDGTSGPHVTVERIRDGTVVTLGGPGMFGRFQSSVTPELEKNLDILVGILAGRPNRIVVRGHASPEELPENREGDPEPGVDDQYDLSFARASNVADFLAARGVDRGRMLVSGVADTEPRVVTRDDALRELNRRVDVFVIDSYTPSPEPSTEDGS